MELMTRSSRARMVGRESSESKCAYVRVAGEVERDSKVSWRSFCSCTLESSGRFEVSRSGALVYEHGGRVTLHGPVYSDQVPQAKICKRVRYGAYSFEAVCKACMFGV